MINTIIDGISEAISDKFGENYDIYTESIEQGLTEPCFSVLCINPASELFFDKRYKKTNQFMIQYFPFSDEKNKECNDVLEKLFDCLEVISTGDVLRRGSKMHGEMKNGVLNFQVNYNMFAYEPDDLDNAMNSYNVKTNT